MKKYMGWAFVIVAKAVLLHVYGITIATKITDAEFCAAHPGDRSQGEHLVGHQGDTPVLRGLSRCERGGRRYLVLGHLLEGPDEVYERWYGRLEELPRGH